ncbi:hypothetical protein V1511DRAFT_22365 [Dipodascopsis uninucleata]
MSVATSNDPWGPSGTDMNEIAQLTFDNSTLFEIMDMIDKRLNDKGKNWRHVMKALVLLDYCIHVGSENVVLWSKDNMYIIKTLREFQYIDEEGRDQGANVRAKAKDLTLLLQDDERLRTERANRSHMRDKMSRPGDDMFRSERTDRRRRRGTTNSLPAEDDDELQRAIEESKQSAMEEERRRKVVSGSPVDEDIARAIKLSKEEEEKRQQKEYYDVQNSNLLFDAFTPAAPAQPQLTGFQPQMTGYNNGYAQPQYPMQTGYQPFQKQQVDLFGNPIYNPSLQQAVSTGYLQNAYAGAPYQNSAVTGMNPTDPYAYAQQQQQQQNLVESPTPGSNNPFAHFGNIKNEASTSNGPSLNQLQQQQTGMPPQQQAFYTGTSNSFKDNQQNAKLNQLLALGEGIDTFGNTGDLRIPAQHTAPGGFINSSGVGFNRPNVNTNPTGTFQTPYGTGVNNPFGVQTAPNTQVQQPQFTGATPFGQGQQQRESLI